MSWLDMKLATTILLVLGLLGSPVGCLVRPCDIADGSHDCCPRTPAFTACPFDILAAAKAAPQQHSLATQPVVHAVMPELEYRQVLSLSVASVDADQRNLHLRNRVLLV